MILRKVYLINDEFAKINKSALIMKQVLKEAKFEM